MIAPTLCSGAVFIALLLYAFSPSKKKRASYVDDRGKIHLL